MQRAGWLPQFSRFAAVGALCTAIQYGLLGIGVEWLGAGAVAASTAGFVVSAGVNYLLNRRFTWGSNAPHRALVWRFVCVLGAGLLLNALFMQLLHGYLHWHYLLAQLLTTGINMLWNFTAHRYWTFARGG
jgi:putative flippase GtrA